MHALLNNKKDNDKHQQPFHAENFNQATGERNKIFLYPTRDDTYKNLTNTMFSDKCQNHSL